MRGIQRESFNRRVAEREHAMKWQELNLTDALIGMHVLVKGYNRNNDKWFFAIGYIVRYDIGYCLRKEIENTPGIISWNRIFDFEKNKYWYINIDEIEE